MPWTLKKFDSEQVFKDKNLEEIKRWAFGAQINPLDELTEDGENWQFAHEIPEFKMDWSVILVDGESYGPTNLATLREFVDVNLLAAENEAVHKKTGEKKKVLILIETQEIDLPPAPRVISLPKPSSKDNPRKITDKLNRKKKTQPVTLASLFQRRVAKPEPEVAAKPVPVADEFQIQPLPCPATSPPPTPKDAIRPMVEVQS